MREGEGLTTFAFTFEFVNSGFADVHKLTLCESRILLPLG